MTQGLQRLGRAHGSLAEGPRCSKMERFFWTQDLVCPAPPREGSWERVLGRLFGEEVFTFFRSSRSIFSMPSNWSTFEARVGEESLLLGERQQPMLVGLSPLLRPQVKTQPL